MQKHEFGCFNAPKGGTLSSLRAPVVRLPCYIRFMKGARQSAVFVLLQVEKRFLQIAVPVRDAAGTGVAGVLAMKKKRNHPQSGVGGSTL